MFRRRLVFEPMSLGIVCILIYMWSHVNNCHQAVADGFSSTLMPFNDSASNESRKETSENITAILNMLVNPEGPRSYDKRLRPDYGGEAVKVGITIHVSSISAVTEVEMDYTIDMYLRQTWTDRRLSFDGGLGDLTIGVEYMNNIWIPDTFFPNEKKSFFHTATTHNSFLRITSSGNVLTSQRLTVIATCPMELQLFPLDSQRCRLEIESYGYSTKDIIYRWDKGENSVVQSSYKLPQFRVNGFFIQEKQEVLSTGNYSRLSCTFKFTRSIGFYLIQVYLPSQLIVIISWVSFWLSRDATPARVALGVTTVLTMTTLMTTTNAAMPKVSYIKSIDIYLITCFFMVFATLLEYAVVGYMNKKLRMKKETGLKSFPSTAQPPSGATTNATTNGSSILNRRPTTTDMSIAVNPSWDESSRPRTIREEHHPIASSAPPNRASLPTPSDIMSPRPGLGGPSPPTAYTSMPGLGMQPPAPKAYFQQPIYATSPGVNSPISKVLKKTPGYRKIRSRFPRYAKKRASTGSPLDARHSLTPSFKPFSPTDFSKPDMSRAYWSSSAPHGSSPQTDGTQTFPYRSILKDSRNRTDGRADGSRTPPATMLMGDAATIGPAGMCNCGPTRPLISPIASPPGLMWGSASVPQTPLGVDDTSPIIVPHYLPPGPPSGLRREPLSTRLSLSAPNYQSFNQAPRLGFKGLMNRKPSMTATKTEEPRDGSTIKIQRPMRSKRHINWVNPSAIDKYSRAVFPLFFLIFNTLYWSIYLRISNIQASSSAVE